MTGGERGMTIVEVLVAAAIIGIGLVGLMYVVPISSYGLSEGNQLSTATFLAEEKLEETRNAVWQATPADDCLGVSAGGAAPTSTTCTRTNPTACAPGTTCVTFSDEAGVAGYTGYSRTVRVADCGVGAGCGGVTDSGLRLVTITVTYTPLTGFGVGTAGKSAILSLLIARR